MSDLQESTTTLKTLHDIVKTYEKEAIAFYSQTDKAAAKYAGRFNFKIFAKKMFDPIPEKELGDIFVKLFMTASEYMHMHKKSKTGDPLHAHSMVSIPELLINMILSYQLPHQKNLVETEADTSLEKNSAEGVSKKKRRNSGGGPRKLKTVTVGPRVVLTKEQSKSLLEHMLMVPLSYETKIWKQGKYVLCPSACPKTLEEFGEIVARVTEQGNISFAALNFFMHDTKINTYFKSAQTILHALYIGPLSAATLEIFAANRSDEFRNDCRQVLRWAQEATRDPVSFRSNRPSNIPEGHPDQVRYRDFVENVKHLLKDLNGDVSGSDTLLHAGWACAAIKKFGHKRYVEKTWKDENFYDLIWTVLAQRPNLKKYICDVLEKQFRDHDAARFWRRMQPYQMDKNTIHNKNVITENPLKPTEDYLNFPAGVKEIKMIRSEEEVNELIGILNEHLEKDKSLLIGVDAEWSAYVNQSKATILQMALRDAVYIIDLESPAISPESYHQFFVFIFDNPDIVKIGFQFGEDLHQLRAGFRNCISLYRPNSVICVGKLITDLLDEMTEKENSDELKKRLIPLLYEENQRENADVSMTDDENVADKTIDSKSNESMEERTDTAKKNGDNGPPSAKQLFSNRGLSFFCEKFLGKPLDKTEQCSVWDRRPLRNLQLRYAAMDAYCMLMLYDKSKLIYNELGLKIEDFVLRQSPVRHGV